MVLTGQVIARNSNHAFAVVAVFDGGFSMFEVVDRTELKPGSCIKGNLHAVGYVTLFHADSGERFRAYGHTGASTLEACHKAMR